MLLIAVVDDDPKDAALLKGHVEEYCRKNDHAALVRVYSDGLDFIRAAETHDIVFLDIQMNKLDGLETARIMRKINHESVLIFVTNMAQFAIKGYEVDALDFIIKPASMASIVYVMDKAMKRIDGGARSMFSLKTQEGTISLSANDIAYVEVFDHNLVYHTTRGEYTVRGRLSDVSEKLDPERFVMCNRSFIVNLRHVSNVTAEYLLIGDTRISVSKSHRKELMKRFSSFLGDSL
ncbi:MAG: LytTR family DNA-binding domain-containing protein [Clostridia bacterium]|nr:LytTR family DNA-binding domain-containing protein [Clostridia bacterium]